MEENLNIPVMKKFFKINDMSFWCFCELWVSVISMELQFNQLGVAP